MPTWMVRTVPTYTLLVRLSLQPIWAGCCWLEPVWKLCDPVWTCCEPVYRPWRTSLQVHFKCKSILHTVCKPTIARGASSFYGQNGAYVYAASALELATNLCRVLLVATLTCMEVVRPCMDILRVSILHRIFIVCNADGFGCTCM